MKARYLQSLLKTKRIVADHGEYIGVASALVHDLFHIDKKSLHMNFCGGSFDSSRKDEELRFIWDKLTELIASGEMRSIIEGQDEITNPKRVFTVKDGKLIETFTDKYGYPNTTIDGKLMHDNDYFKTKEKAIKYGQEEDRYLIKLFTGQIEEHEEKIRERKNRIAVCQSNIDHLELLIPRRK